MSSQPVERPLGGLKEGIIGKSLVKLGKTFGVKTSISGQKRLPTHSGVLVTTIDGKNYLVHKTKDGTGPASKTVVVDAKHMSNSWKRVGPSKDVGGKATVGEYVKAGGKDYNLRNDNCHDATDKMKQLGRRKRCA